MVSRNGFAANNRGVRDIRDTRTDSLELDLPLEESI